MIFFFIKLKKKKSLIKLRVKSDCVSNVMIAIVKKLVW